jgi:hypothetical protein
MWNGCSEMRKREGEKERGEILNEDGRLMGWMKWYNLPTKGSFTSSRLLVQEGQQRKRKEWEIERENIIFFGLLFL